MSLMRQLQKRLHILMQHLNRELKNGRQKYIGVMWMHPDATIVDIVHESFHGTHYFLQSLGLYLNDGSEEAYAYLISDIFAQAQTHLKLDVQFKTITKGSRKHGNKPRTS